MKHGDDIYLVVRDGEMGSYVCGVYQTVELADLAQARFTQHFIDKGLDNLVNFRVQISTYHDE